MLLSCGFDGVVNVWSQSEREWYSKCLDFQSMHVHVVVTFLCLLTLNRWMIILNVH